MEKMKRVKIGYIVFLMISFALMLLMVSYKTDKVVPKEPEAIPAPPEAPRLSDIKVVGETLIFDPETRYYEIKIPDGNPVIPQVMAVSASRNVDIKVDQAIMGSGATVASAKIYLDDGKMQNSYEVKFVKTEAEGFVLQYDDRYTFVPDYTLKENEVFTYQVVGEGANVVVDENGVIRAVGVSDRSATVNAFVNETLVDSMTVNETVNAVIDIFIVAGQGNAAGENGSAFESINPPSGTAYTAELNDRYYEMKDLSEGRTGFTPALAENWYSLTGEKSLFIQTAVSDVSITEWVQSGEAFDLAMSRFEYYRDKLNDENSPYTVKRTFVIWLHGEWDIANNMTSGEYIYYFNDFYNGFKEKASPDMFAIIPVRSSLETDGAIEAVCSAQYALANTNPDIRIITRLTETANEENGFISNGNLYYTQNGYNEIGKDVAYNLFMCYSPESDRAVQKIEVFGNAHHTLLEDNATVELKNGETVRTVALVLPLYAENKTVNVKYDSTLLTYYTGGVIEMNYIEGFDGVAEITFECSNVDFSFNVKRRVEEEFSDSRNVTYRWDFDGLAESLGRNDLILSEKSNAEKYIIENGILITNEKQVDFVLQKPLKLTSSSDWSIAWKGMLNDTGMLMGNDSSPYGCIYLAPFAKNINSVRLVDDGGKAFYLRYGEAGEMNREMGEWSVRYDAESMTFSLYFGEELLYEYAEQSEFTFTFTNLLGRFESETVNYCYAGSLDWLEITCNYGDAVEEAEE
ncbi:MAG: hypothetical protein IJN17_06375 [Clostridia bacterium]|nr:hypothetical protein [Clostridia bacterium]